MEKYDSFSYLSNEQLILTLKQAEEIGLHQEFIQILINEIKKRNLSIES
ncbi:sporulation inhibitor A [Aneurinibacillus soli]|uniref:Sporulation inhibitor A n=1 Tax=Aneurinibacillus soli TaxID=1500254 RepID=A0A0U5AXP4_9BACL|nr:sporulation inhibitor A [Aneurinibacillus soli]BAU28506.1 Sporulation inhibitor A [Aneurinibacillus soli]